MFRGGVSDGTDFVVKNGTVVAATDQPIVAGATELFDDAPFTATFFANAINNNGQFVIGGTTNSALGTDFDAVLVFNNQFVIAREGDPVDLDGNGLFDDNVFIDVFGNDDLTLTDDLQVHFVASLQDANNVAVGNALMVITVPEPASMTMLATGALLFARRRRTR
jgi:hypothetical protein